jgi:hypothetical protein
MLFVSWDFVSIRDGARVLNALLFFRREVWKKSSRKVPACATFSGARLARQPDFLHLSLRQQRGSLDQSAEFFFAHMMMLALAGEEIDHGLVAHLQPLQLHDAEIFLALFVNLVLPQFHLPHPNFAHAGCERILAKLYMAFCNSLPVKIVQSARKPGKRRLR